MSDGVDCVGKLLICLTASHDGGHLLFTHGGETKELVTETSCRWGYSYVTW